MRSLTYMTDPKPRVFAAKFTFPFPVTPLIPDRGKVVTRRIDIRCGEKVLWYERFRKAAYVNTLVWMIWTVAILLPIAPFSYLQPIMAGGGAGTWFLVGYILFLAAAVVGFIGISSLAFVIEVHEQRSPNYSIMITGFILLYAGILASCLLLGIAGATGGYAMVIQTSTVTVAQNLLSPYVDPITAASSIAVAGTGLTVYAMATAKATKS